jgi:hypothetical protein
MKRFWIQAVAAMLAIVLHAPLGAAAAQVEPGATIDISGHPFKGPANAPITVVVFSDYL